MAKRQRQAAPAGQAAPRGAKRSRQGRKNDVYEAEDSDPEEEKHTDRYDVSAAAPQIVPQPPAAPSAPLLTLPAPRPPQRVENYEYEMPSDFEDEEIDEEAAFDEDDKKRYAGWFDDAPAARGGGRGGAAGRSEFADLESSEEEGPGGAGEGEVRPWGCRDEPGSTVRRCARRLLPPAAAGAACAAPPQRALHPLLIQPPLSYYLPLLRTTRSSSLRRAAICWPASTPAAATAAAASCGCQIWWRGWVKPRGSWGPTGSCSSGWIKRGRPSRRRCRARCASGRSGARGMRRRART